MRIFLERLVLVGGGHHRVCTFHGSFDQRSPFENTEVQRVTACVLVFFREKKLLVSSEDYGRDLTGVQNLRKKHKRLEAELAAHEPAIQVRRASVAEKATVSVGPGAQRNLTVLVTLHHRPGRRGSEFDAEAFP